MADINKPLNFNVSAGGELRADNLFELNATTPNFPLAWTIQRATLASEFIGRFDPKVTEVRPTKVVVVSQEPGPDMFLPAGTPVNLFMAVKEDLPVKSFTNIETVVTDKYQVVGTLMEDLGKANDAVAGAAKRVLEEKSEVNYSELAAQDKSAVNAFIRDRFNVNADVAADKEKAENIYENLRFLNSF